MSTKQTIKNAKGGPDRDLMAMQTLLRIRSDSVTDAKPSPPATTKPQVQQKILPAVVPSAPIAPAPIAPAHSALQGSIGQSTHRQATFPPHVSAMTAFYPQSPAFLPLEPAALGVSTPVSPAILSMGYPAQSTVPQTQQILKPASNGNSTKEEDAKKAAIRKDEVEAALRSKPQRGRKRDNLSTLERLELTRTRNREHAKSTRIRKKARYQELLDNEKKYEDLKTRDELNSGREQSVSQLVSVLSSMLSGKKGDVVDHPETPNREKTVSFSDETPVASRMVSPEALGSVVESTKGFFFCVIGAPAMTESRGETTTGILSMDRFCQQIISKALDVYGARALGRISCKMDTSNGGLALNKANIGFANVQVVLTDEDRDHQLVLVDAILQGRFAPSSSLLESVQWCTLSEKFDQLVDMEDAESTSESSGESLGLRTSYPSVVSLDPLVSADDKPRNEKEGTPNLGITI